MIFNDFFLSFITFYWNSKIEVSKIGHYRLLRLRQDLTFLKLLVFVTKLAFILTPLHVAKFFKCTWIKYRKFFTSIFPEISGVQDTLRYITSKCLARNSSSCMNFGFLLWTKSGKEYSDIILTKLFDKMFFFTTS